MLRFKQLHTRTKARELLLTSLLLTSRAHSPSNEVERSTCASWVPTSQSKFSLALEAVTQEVMEEARRGLADINGIAPMIEPLGTRNHLPTSTASGQSGTRKWATAGLPIASVAGARLLPKLEEFLEGDEGTGELTWAFQSMGHR